MPNPVFKGLQIIYSPACVHIPNSSWLAARADRGRNSPPGFGSGWARPFLPGWVLIEFVTNEGSVEQPGQAQLEQEESKSCPIPAPSLVMLGSLWILVAGLVTLFGAGLGVWAGAGALPALGRLNIVFVSCAGCRLGSARCSFFPSTTGFLGRVLILDKVHFAFVFLCFSVGFRMVVHKNAPSWACAVPVPLRRHSVPCVQEGLILQSCAENFWVFMLCFLWF